VRDRRSFLASLHGRFGCLAGRVRLVNALDDTDGDSLSHVTHGESSEGWVLGEGLHAHWLRWGHQNNGGITGLDFLGEVLHLLTRTSVDLFFKFGELAGDVGGVAIQHWRVAVSDLTRVIHDNDLGGESLRFLGWVIFRVRSDVATTDVLDGHVLHVEPDVVTRSGLLQRFVMHLNRLDFGGHHNRRKGDDHTGLDDTGLDSANGHSSNATDFVDILEGKSEWLVVGSLGRDDGIERLEHGGALELALFDLLVPSLVPAHVGRGFDHVVSVPSGNGDKGNSLGVETDLLHVVRDFGLDFGESLLAVWGLGGVHLVNSDDELLDTQRVGEKGVLTCLAVLGDTGLELTDTGGDDQDGTIGLRCSRDHVLDEITMAGSINDGDEELGGQIVTPLPPRGYGTHVLGLELPESDIDGDTTFTLGLELVQNPSVLEGTFAHFLGFLLELLDSSLVDSSAFVDQMAGGGGLAGVDVTDNDDVDMSLVFATWCHGEQELLLSVRQSKSDSKMG